MVVDEYLAVAVAVVVVDVDVDVEESGEVLTPIIYLHMQIAILNLELSNILRNNSVSCLHIEKYQAQQIKIVAGWINGYTPPHGLILKSDGYAVPYLSVISSAEASFSQPPSMIHITLNPKPCHVGMIQPPPPTNAIPIVPLTVN